jgi:hypothetical protein
MTHQLLEKNDRRLAADSGESRLFDAGAPRTLDDLVSRLSQSLAVRGNAACPVCGATLISTAEAAADASAECRNCGTQFE